MSEDTRTELRLLRQQVASDFHWTVQALGDLDTRVTTRLNQLSADFSDTTRQLQGRMRLLEERFSRFLGLVEDDVTGVHSQLQDHETRLRRLEGGSPAA